MSMTVRYEMPWAETLYAYPKTYNMWRIKHKRKAKKAILDLSRHLRGINTPRLKRDLTGEEKIQDLYSRMDEAFKKSSVQILPNGDQITYLGLQRDMVQRGKKIILGIRPIFEKKEMVNDFINATYEEKVTKFAGSLTPVRQYPAHPNRYEPHQGKRECARRLA